MFLLTRSSRHWTPGCTELQAGVRGLTVDDVSDDTKLIMSQLHRREGQSEEPVVQPIVHSTIYRIKSVDHYRTVSNEVSHNQPIISTTGANCATTTTTTTTTTAVINIHINCAMEHKLCALPSI